MAQRARYVVVGLRRRGTTSDLLDATELHDGGLRRVLIKRLRNPEDEESINAFFDECQVLRELSHPNIVEMLDVGVSDGRPFQVFEIAAERDLAEIISAATSAGESLGRDLALLVVAEVARALEYAHTRPGLSIVHRDVTPENILVSRAGKVTLADFGIAIFEERSGSTRAGLAKGKLFYMAPEQLLASHVDWRADIFSLGCVLCELLTGHTPLESQANMDRALLGESLELDAELDEDVNAVLSRMLAPDRRERFDSAGAVERECRRLIERDTPAATQALARTVEALTDALAQTRVVASAPEDSEVEAEFELDLESTAGERRNFAHHTPDRETLLEVLTFFGETMDEQTTGVGNADGLDPQTLVTSSSPPESLIDTDDAIAEAVDTVTAVPDFEEGTTASRDLPEKRTPRVPVRPTPSQAPPPQAPPPIQSAPPLAAHAARARGTSVTRKVSIAVTWLAVVVCIATIAAVLQTSSRDAGSPVESSPLAPAAPSAEPALAPPRAIPGPEPRPSTEEARAQSDGAGAQRSVRPRRTVRRRAKRDRRRPAKRAVSDAELAARLRKVLAVLVDSEKLLSREDFQRFENAYLDLGSAANRSVPAERSALLKKADALRRDITKAADSSGR